MLKLEYKQFIFMWTDFGDTYPRIPLKVLKRRINHLQEINQSLFISMYIYPAWYSLSNLYLY